MELIKCQRILYLSLFFLAVSTPISSFSQYRNISLGSSLTSLDNTSFWESPSGDFAFGFREIVDGGFLLAIWFNKIPERTVVWSANGANLAPRGSTIQLTSYGLLQLNDPKGEQIWSPASANSEVAYAALLDTGNFVLARKDFRHLWESFHDPTDTILPTQTLSQLETVSTKLSSRYSETNYSTGRFQLLLQTDGNLLLYTTHFPSDASSVSYDYWSTNTEGNGNELIFNQSGSIYLGDGNGAVVTTISVNAPPTKDFYQLAILEYDGVFRHYVYPKSTSVNGGKWPTAWSSVASIPINICQSMNVNRGSGACGFNSYCKLGLDNKAECLCPNGYSPLDPNYTWRGCKPVFAPQSCDQASPESHLFDIYQMEYTDWPYSDYDFIQPVNEDGCRQVCLDDCFCTASIFRDNSCWKLRSPLSNGRVDSSIQGKALMKIRKDNFTTLAVSASVPKSNAHIIELVLLWSSVFLNIFFAASICHVFRNYCRRYKTIPRFPYVADVTLKSFTYEELTKATNGFKEEVGRGAFAAVYKGRIFNDDDDDDGSLIAVKRLDSIAKHSEVEFKAEVTAIARTNHRNLVRLLGYCHEGSHRLLVYELMANGSLANFLFNGSRPDWHQRIEIALETARGLLYLHEECSTRIVHCDIKPQNILLDESYRARICDFGLSKLLKMEQSRTTTRIRGTKGYVAPEWFRRTTITVKVDVYSYGVVLLQLICCRKNFEEDNDEDEMVLVDWVYDCFKAKKLQMLVEEDENAIYDLKKVERLVMIALWCIQEDPSLRPTMRKVIQMFEGVMEVPVPPNPTSFMS